MLPERKKNVPSAVLHGRKTKFGHGIPKVGGADLRLGSR